MRQDRVPYFLALLILILATCSAVHTSLNQPFWFDEIGTLRLAELAPGPQLWQAMIGGFEFNPPLAYVVTHASESMLGRGQFSSRLPFLLAGMGTLCLLFIIQAVQRNPWAGVWTMLFFINTEALAYFSEARAYSLVMFGATSAWYFWDCTKSSSPWRYAGIFLSLSIALLSHMWAVVLIPCFLIAILFDSYKSKWIDIKAILAVLATSVITLSYGPIVKASKGVTFDNIIYHTPLYQSILAVIGKIVLCFIVLLVLWVLSDILFQSRIKTKITANINRQTVLATCFLFAPAVIFTITEVTKSASMTRYALIATIGASILMGCSFNSLFQRSNKVMQAAFLTLPIFLFSWHSYTQAKELRQQSNQRPSSQTLLSQKQQSAPIVFANGLDFLPLHFYAKPELAKDLLFVAEPSLAIKYTGSDGIDSALRFGSSYMHINGNLLALSDLISRKTPFWLLKSKHELTWIEKALVHAGFQIQTPAEPQSNLVLVQPLQPKSIP